MNDPQNSNFRRAGWLAAKRWGVMLHFLAGEPGDGEPRSDEELSPEAWNERVDACDVDGLADQLAECGAGYILFAIGQNSGHYCAPNAAYCALTGSRKLSRRDLISDLADACATRDVRTMVYVPANAPLGDVSARNALKFTPPWDATRLGMIPGSYLAEDGVDGRLTYFQTHWERILTEWSLRWGSKVSGWWVDGCWEHARLYDYADEPNFRSFARALRAGNPAACVSFSNGVHAPFETLTPETDYTAGETSPNLPVGDWGWTKRGFGALGAERNGAVTHVLSFLGEVWASGPPRFPDQLVSGYTRFVNDCGGAVTWDVPFRKNGLLPEPFLRQLNGINAVAPAQKSG